MNYYDLTAQGYYIKRDYSLFNRF